MGGGGSGFRRVVLVNMSEARSREGCSRTKIPNFAHSSFYGSEKRNYKNVLADVW